MKTMCPIDKIVRAAGVISSTIAGIETQELLHHHRQTLQIAFENLGQILSLGTQGTLLSAKPQSRSTEPLSLTRGRNQASNHDHNQETSETTPSTHSLQSPVTGDASSHAQEKQDDKVSNLMDILRRHSKKIHAFTDKEEADAVFSKKQWTQRDPRYVDIELTKRNRTWTQKFRGWLARYSFADEYLTWAQKKFGKSREEYLNLTAEDADNRGKGHVTEFLASVHDKDESIRKEIQYGLKYHSFEHIYGSRGASAVLFGVSFAFRQITYPHMQPLADSIRRSSTWSDLAEKKADWVSQCFLIYNEDYENFRKPKGQKRAFDSEGVEQSQKRHSGVIPMPTLALEWENPSDAHQDDRSGDIHISANSPTPNAMGDNSTGDKEIEQPMADGYDPFQVDFNFLLHQLDGQNPEIMDPRPCFEKQVSYETDGYDPFQVDFNFLQGLDPDRTDIRPSHLGGNDKTGRYVSQCSSSKPQTAC